MADTQYELFRDLDRHCVAVSMNSTDCREAVRRKRESIDSLLNRENPLVREVLEGRTTFTAIYDGFSQEFRGIRRFLPKSHSEAYNERLECFGKIVPNVRHFTRRSLFAMDNPVTCAFYGVIAAVAVSLVWAHAQRTEVEGASGMEGFSLGTLIALALGCGAAGMFAGLFAMLRYRTRQSDSIHAREAAAYMDLNYTCHRTGDDGAWAKFVALKATPPAGSTPPAKNAGASPKAGDHAATATT